MAASAVLTLDTTAPAGVTLDIGSGTVSSRDVTAAIATTDGSTSGYSMRIYGDVDDTFAPTEYRAAQANAPWVSFNASKAVRLSSGDGVKTVTVQVRDPHGNISTAVSDSVTLNTAIPVVTIMSGPSPSTISKVATFDTSTMVIRSSLAIDEVKVKVVAAAGDAHTTGTLIPETAGSETQAAGAVAANTDIAITIKGADLEAASAGDGPKVIKAFVKGSANQLWSQGAS